MRPNRMVERLKAGETLFGVACTYGHAGLVEALGRGWDWVWIDGQHGLIDYGDAADAVRAAENVGCEPLLRVPAQDYGTLGKWADLGPAAVMVPMVNNAREAGAVVEGLRYPPLGRRSYGGRRVYDVNGPEFFRRPLLVLAQIETIEAIDQADAIVQTEGIDGLFLGADDVRLQLGVPISTPLLENATLLRAFDTVGRVCRATGKFAGLVAATPDLARAAVERGYQVLAGGSDIGFMRVAGPERLMALRKAVGRH